MSNRKEDLHKALPPEPEKPLRDDCCGGGACCPCIWDVYYDKLAKWKEAKQKLESENENQAPNNNTNEPAK
ncbi:oxidoreductase-like domain-containing protein [Alteromonas gracilis]|uniref:oxidoreductase-like domain-containing protein n=1 Tax=Alteromonas gracilis TaxID=1479524 RepID=UPI00373673C2